MINTGEDLGGLISVLSKEGVHVYVGVLTFVCAHAPVLYVSELIPKSNLKF